MEPNPPGDRSLAEDIREKIAVVGLGRVGSVLGKLFVESECQFLGGYSEKEEKAEEALKKIGGGKLLSPERLNEAEAVFLCVQDSRIERVSEEISALSLPFRRMSFIQCSGSLGREALNSLFKRGASVSVFHPLFPFFDFEFSVENIKGTYVSIDGEEWLFKLAERIGLHPFFSPSNRGKYHLGASLSSGLLLSLLSFPLEIAEEIGIPKEAYIKLAEAALKGAEEFSLRDAVTGPWKRGDDEVIKKHVENCSDLILYSRLLRRAKEIIGKD